MSRDFMKKFNNLKIDIALRFKLFRKLIKKSQQELADELGVHQSTITNIEKSNIFPNMQFIHKLCLDYDLNANWLITGKGEMFLTKENKLLTQSVKKDKDILELIEIIENIPEIRQIIFAELTKAKAIFKDKIEEYRANQQKDKDEDNLKDEVINAG